MTDASAPEKKSKGELEQLVKANGGKIYQTNTAVPNTICIADRSTHSFQRSEAMLTVQRDRQGGFAAEKCELQHCEAILVD